MEQLSLFSIQSTLETNQSKKEVSKPQQNVNWLVIDGNNLLNRCYYATVHSPRGILKAPDGRFTNGIVLFLRMMLNYKKSYNAQVVVMFDEGKSYRKIIYPEYKDGRSETPQELKEQFPLLQEILEHADVPVFKDPEYEADDLIASFAEQVDDPVYILSNDHDTYQLITERVSVIVRKKKEDILMTPERFQSEFPGLQPTQIIDIKALAGDTSDNILGVPGIGEKGALSLIREFGTVEALIAAEQYPKNLNRYKSKVENGKEEAVFAKKLTTLHRDIPLRIPADTLNFDKLRESCRNLGMNSILSLL